MAAAPHKLAVLRQWVPEVHLPITPREQERLTDFAVATRYPGHAPLALEEASRAVEVAREVQGAARAMLPPEALTR